VAHVAGAKVKAILVVGENTEAVGRLFGKAFEF
jgi:hypothetical protein